MMKNINEGRCLTSRRIIRYFLLLILSILLFGCNFPSTHNIVQPDRSQSLTPYSTPYVDVQFNLELPQPLDPGEKIYIVIIDEVTGLPYNRQEYEMDQEGENNFKATLSIPMFSVIKYRYEKVGNSDIPEKQANGLDVRYRMCLVKKETVVNDILSSWDSLNTPSLTGQFEAVVIDKDSGAPLPDILVGAGGQLNFTDANGIVKFDGLSPGIHNLLFYSITGEYATFQQGAVISENQKTYGEIPLKANKAVEVTFTVSPPTDAMGAPVYLAGNLAQFGNTFSDLLGSMSIDSTRMPVLSSQDDELTLTVTLYSGTDFRFKFTLGDGYWNAELNADSELLTRQLIVPDQDTTVALDIAAWRAPLFQPITFETFVHPDIGYPGERYIQFKQDEWTEPIRLWPIGDGNYLYILYGPFEITDSISYRVCLTRSCDTINSNDFISDTGQVEPTDQPLTRSIAVDGWLSPSIIDPEENIREAVFPYKAETFNTIIEISPEMTPEWYSSIPKALGVINKMYAETVIFDPRWVQNQSNGLLKPEIGTTPFAYELINYIHQAQTHELNAGLYPQIAIDNNSNNFPEWSENSEAWQKEWLGSYRQFILNYAKVAEISGADFLIMGGKPVLPALPGANPVFLQDSLEEDWRAMIWDIRQEFKGKLIWAVNAGKQMDPLPSFIDLFDEIYISIDSPLSTNQNPSFDEIAYGFTSTIDNLIYEVYRSTFKPITVSLAYPSLENAALGCELIDSGCSNDGLFVREEIHNYQTSLDQQTLIYNAVLPVAASREWITGISVRGYIPLGTPDDPTSSIAGKPAQNVIEYWYEGLN